MGSLEFALQTVAKLLCSCLCLWTTINEFHAMDEKCSTTFSLEVEVDVLCDIDLFNPEILYFMYVLKTFITSN